MPHNLLCIFYIKILKNNILSKLNLYQEYKDIFNIRKSVNVINQKTQRKNIYSYIR